MSDPKTDVETLMNSALPFAERMLSEYGEFLPYGEAMRANGEIVSVGASSGDEHPPSQDLIDILKNGYRESAQSGEYKATALVYDIRTIPPSSSEKIDAVAVALDHVDDYSVVVIFPYTLEGTDVSFRKAFAQKGQADIFE